MEAGERSRREEKEREEKRSEETNTKKKKNTKEEKQKKITSKRREQKRGKRRRRMKNNINNKKQSRRRPINRREEEHESRNNENLLIWAWGADACGFQALSALLLGHCRAKTSRPQSAAVYFNKRKQPQKPLPLSQSDISNNHHPKCYIKDQAWRLDWYLHKRRRHCILRSWR